VAPLCRRFDCHDFLSRLVDSARWDELCDCAAPSGPEDVAEQLQNSFEILDLQQTELHPSLEALGISPVFLRLAGQGYRAVSDYFKDWAGARLGRSFAAPQISPRVVDALITLTTRHKHSLSPWTGAIVSTRNSLGPEWYLFESEGSGFIAGMFSEAPFLGHDTVWILPAVRKVLYVRAGFARPSIIGVCWWVVFHLAKRVPALMGYLKSSERTVAVYDWHCDFGHYVWNVLSAWSSFFQLLPLNQAVTIASASPHSYFGNIKDIFQPESGNVTEESVRSIDQLYDIGFRKPYLLSCVRACYITEVAAGKVVRHAMSRCEPEFRRRLLDMRRNRWPLVLFSLRLDNRSWVDQTEGFAEIAAHVRRDFPNAAFALHGLSKGGAMIWDTARMSLEAEVQAARALERTLGGPRRVANAVGLSMHESVAVSYLCDVFVAPVGSGMGLYKWLTNKPGVAFSNTFCVNPANPYRWTFLVFESYRENIIPSTYIPLSSVTDIEAAHHGQASRANFTLNRSHLYATLRDLLLSVPWESRALPRPTPSRNGPAGEIRRRKRRGG
jgi:hypothetical protein